MGETGSEAAKRTNCDQRDVVMRYDFKLFRSALIFLLFFFFLSCSKSQIIPGHGCVKEVLVFEDHIVVLVKNECGFWDVVNVGYFGGFTPTNLPSSRLVPFTSQFKPSKDGFYSEDTFVLETGLLKEIETETYYSEGVIDSFHALNLKPRITILNEHILPEWINSIVTEGHKTIILDKIFDDTRKSETLRLFIDNGRVTELNWSF